VRHEGTVKGERRIREDAAAIADCGLRIADFTASTLPQPAAPKGMQPRISRIEKIFQRKVAKTQSRKEEKNSLRPCAFAPLRFFAFYHPLSKGANVHTLPNHCTFRCHCKGAFPARFAPFCRKSAQLIYYQQLTTKIEHFQLRSIEPN